jgi:hypothetical protein
MHVLVVNHIRAGEGTQQPACTWQAHTVLSVVVHPESLRSAVCDQHTTPGHPLTCLLAGSAQCGAAPSHLSASGFQLKAARKLACLQRFLLHHPPFAQKCTRLLCYIWQEPTWCPGPDSSTYIERQRNTSHLQNPRYKKACSAQGNQCIGTWQSIQGQIHSNSVVSTGNVAIPTCLLVFTLDMISWQG